ncbi:MAG TPA: carboxypeptidase regulatory-like domain-containing protein, partial [Candidatus Angelobacter sp.]
VLATLGCNSSQPPHQPPSSASSLAESALVKVDPATAGEIAGVVSFKGSGPELASLDMTQDPGCPTQLQPSDAFVMKNGRLANVVVYVKDGLPQGKFAVPSESVVLDQKGCRYVPHMLGLMSGQPLKILNSDTADHNIHDLPRNNPEWNQSQMPTDPPIIKSFAHPEMMIPLQCNQHPWMRAYVSVMSHPYFAVSAADGSFLIKNLPPGEYTLAAVHEKFGEQTMKVKVSPKQSARADFSFAP